MWCFFFLLLMYRIFFLLETFLNVFFFKTPVDMHSVYSTSVRAENKTQQGSGWELGVHRVLGLQSTPKTQERERECTAEEWWWRGRREPSAGQIVSRVSRVRDTTQKWEGHCLKAEDLFSSKYATWAAGRKHEEKSSTSVQMILI